MEYFPVLQELDYPDIISLCKSNKRLYQICRGNPLVRSLIFEKYQTHIELKYQEYIWMNSNDPCGTSEVLEDIDEWQSKFLLACQYGDLEMAEYIYKHHRIDLNFDQSLAIRTAIKHGQTSIVEFLSEIGIALNRDILNLAVTEGNIDMVRSILKSRKTFPDSETITIAVRFGYADILHLLLQGHRYQKIGKDVLYSLVMAHRFNKQVFDMVVSDPRVTKEAIAYAIVKAIHVCDTNLADLLIQTGKFDWNEVMKYKDMLHNPYEISYLMDMATRAGYK